MSKKEFALVGDVWYEIMDCFVGIDNSIQYKLYSLDYPVPSGWIKKIKEMD
jgi:hypothetical protein